MVEPSLPRGMRDFNTAEAIARREVLAVVEETFKRFGFSPIETPALENLNVLYAKTYGEESGKEIFKIEGEDAALRYDFTVPLARFIAMNKDTPLPFKRYQIGSIWRKDEPQRMRYREFLQVDIDIVGSSELISDAEVIAVAAQILDELGISGYKILINDRIILNGILSFFGIPNEKSLQAIRLIDKLPKIGNEEVIKGLVGLGIKQENATSLIEFIIKEEGNDEKLNRIEANIGLKEEVNKLRELIRLVRLYKAKGDLIVDLSLARGFDYYTSLVWEFIVYDENGKRLPSIAGGGRYDNLIGIFLNQQIPATGISIGIDRIMNVIGSSTERKSYARVYVATVGNVLDYSLYVANALRGAGINTDINMTKRNIAKQLEYANAMRFRYVAIVGEREQSSNKLKLRDMVSGNEELLDIDEAIKVIKGE
ncbi:MAG: histidine--tRNA ligase [Candidatus Micrarchaeota archaeon]